MTRTKGQRDQACRRCEGSRCAYCGMSGLERMRRQLGERGEHRAVTGLDLAAHAWAAAEGTREAKTLAGALTDFARTVTEALTAPGIS